ncbi:ABC transporter substrate-binding protein [Gammaproteobacteria bacterium]|nr:ABC transporter substrate-binding protein [Gammaproteobacteria bacterium]
MKFFLSSFFFSIWISTVSIAQVSSNLNSLDTNIVNNYKALLSEKVTNDLLLNYKLYLESPNKYWNFLNETFLDNWDFDATTKALIGNKIFNSLTNEQFKTLSRTLEVTLIRYAFESLSFYGSQKLNVIDIKVNEKQTFAWLKINMDSPRFPDIHLDLLLKRKDDDKWRGVDFRFKGITYVNLKKNGYRKDFEALNFKGLFRKLEDKNNLFFKDLCQGQANYLDPKMPPCS